MNKYSRIYRLTIICWLILPFNDLTKAEEYDISQGKSVQEMHYFSYSDAGTCAIDLNLYTSCLVHFAYDFDGNYNIPWMQIDLKGIYNVTKIIVFTSNYNVNVETRYFDIYVRATNNTNSYIGYFCSSVTDNLIAGMSINCTRPAGMIGRYVFLKKDSSHLYHHLSLSEIIVISDNKDYQLTTIQSTSQSHVFHHPVNYSASNAVDGNIATCSYTAQEDATLRTNGGWWMAELGETYDISAVRIENWDSANYEGTRFSIYVREMLNGARKLCYSQNTEVSQWNLNLKCSCDPIVNGRFLQIVKENFFRIDNLFLCEVTVFVLHAALQVKYPSNFIPTSSTSSLFSTINTPSTTKCKPLICEGLICGFGYKKDDNNCEICKCIDPCETVVCSAGFICKIEDVLCLTSPCIPVTSCRQSFNTQN